MYRCRVGSGLGCRVMDRKRAMGQQNGLWITTVWTPGEVTEGGHTLPVTRSVRRPNLRDRPELPDLPELFLGSDAVQAGDLSPTQLRSPLLRRIVRDVYAPRRVPQTHLLRCRAAALVVEPGCAITARSAATVHGVDLATASDPVELVTSPSGRQHRRPGITVTCTKYPVQSVPWHGARLATPVHAAFDIARAGWLPRAVGEVDAMVRAGLLTRGNLVRYLTGRHDHGIGAAREVARLIDARAQSIPESIVRVLLAQDDLAAEPQVSVVDEMGLIGMVDLALRRWKTAIEYDGVWHGSPHRVGADRERLNRLHAAGWRVVFVTAEDLRNPGQICARVRAALDSRS